MASRALRECMRSPTALAIGIGFIFAAALVVEFTGFVDRPAPTAEADPAGEGAATSEPTVRPVDEGKLRMGVMGGFIVACIFILMRATGEYF